MALGYGRTGTNNFATAKFIVDSNGLQTGATHTTIQGAIDDASDGDTIFVRPGTYTENITGKDGVLITGFQASEIADKTLIVGKVSMSSGRFKLAGLALHTNGDYCLEATGTGNIQCRSCYIEATDNDAVSNSGTGSITLRLCTGGVATTGVKVCQNTSTGSISFRYCNWGNAGGSTVASTASAGGIRIQNSELAIPWSTSGSGVVNITGSFFDNTAINTSTITHNSSQPSTIANSEIASGTASDITITSGTVRATNVRMLSSNTNAVTGAGTFQYGQITLVNSNAINPTGTSNDDVFINTLKLNTALDEVYGGTGQTTYSTGDILYASGSNTLAKLAAGTNGNVLTLAAGVPSWAAAGGGGAWELISTATASTSATISFTNLSSSYFMYLVQCDNVQGDTNFARLRMRTSTNNGSSYDSGSSDYAYRIMSPTSSSVGVTSSTGDNEIILSRDQGGNAANEKYSLSIYIMNPSSTEYTRIYGFGNMQDDSTDFFQQWFGGVRLSAADVDAIQFYYNSGNIETGTFKLYGLSAS